MANGNGRKLHGSPGPHTGTENGEPFPDEARRLVFFDRQVAIVREREADAAFDRLGWQLIAMANDSWYTVEYVGTDTQADALAGELAAPTIASHEMRTAFEMRTVHLTEELAAATGQTAMEVPLLAVRWVPDDSVYVVGNRHRLWLNPGIVVPTGPEEQRRNERRGREVAYVAAVFEDREARFRKATRDTSEVREARF